MKPYYSKNKGRPSLDPLILFKMMFIGYLYGIVEDDFHMRIF
ncbi:hypothetical protein B4144_0390 [Bacillus atrophaeus]|nr:hypothetical protein B4144_0390 [Bacillus atrophaeus]